MANEIENRIQEQARRLLESGEVTMVIGWGAGSAPFKTTPVFIEKPEDVEKLVWNPACTNNLAVYLPSFDRLRMTGDARMTKDGTAKVGIVVKPCDSRSVVTLIQEKQVARENLVIIGVTCSGITDDSALRQSGTKLNDIRALDWDGDTISITNTNGKSSVPIIEAVREGCKTCEIRTPVVSDVTFGDAPVVESLHSPDSLHSLHSPEERRAYWAEQFEKCIRCYACRQVCPNCYCSKCFADRNDVKWTNKKPVTSENWMWHMGRAMHQAGRCIACGECERVCPMEIPLMTLNREVQRHVSELFDFTPGMDLDAEPVLGAFDPGDPDPNEH